MKTNDLMDNDVKQVRRRKKKPASNSGHPSQKNVLDKPEKQRRSREQRADMERKKITSIVILCVEGLVLCTVVYGLIYFSGKLKSGEFTTDAKKTEEASSQEGSGDGSGSTAGSVNVNNDNFSLTCTKVQLTTDTDGNPAALIFFTFVNKTSTPLSLGEVFPPKVMQEGVDCETFASLANPPEEFYNRDTQIQDGASIEACYAIKLQNTTSELTLTIHDNYETFTDIGSTLIPLS